MNRMQRRARDAAARQSLIREYRRDGQIAGMIQNGISSEDLQRKYTEGFDRGYKEAAMPMFKTCIAAACLALKEVYGMDQNEIYRGASEVGNKILFCLSNQEMVEEVLDKTGIVIDINDSLGAVQQK